MGKLVAAVVLGFLGLSVFSDYPLIGFGLIAVAALLVWVAMQGRRSARPVAHARPVEWARARQESQMEVARAEREARAVVRRAVRQTDKRGQAAIQRAAALVQSEQSSGWSA
ncbi:Uncharacterised protein [Mycobacteroides abscessus subsp. massiliense]|uniref:hypothetical protein n=1 Tax=Mycobacteroides TaxID=670516 RepID=UPI0003A67A98|nr:MULTISPECIES: hypothetical protein [Mycobacteroides]MBV0918018.1 hypothetical protein [Mycobacteroides chelonae]RIT59403.1 hypothetical protein D2E95_09440 [Mycobacteroides abscessus]RIU52487.1 hypothetical protein D2F02_05590 [Mycobacteroides abscessus]SHX53377.1 Uncharacterised protein [Mycobacteroides abscessus subsp. abscessus]SKM75344.1 Uncharacterised protein [Mycobacteroides abscessus subsp. massiliense]